MTAAEFRAALADLGMSQAAFARLLAEHGHPATDVARSVRRWCGPSLKAGGGPPGEVVVILRLLAEQATRDAAAGSAPSRGAAAA